MKLIIKFQLSDQKYTRRFIILFALIACSYLPGKSQDKDLLYGKAFQIQSKVLNEKRELMIYCPAGSSTAKAKYPVIYVLDGESLFLSTVAALRFMNYSNSFPLLPEAYVVGIRNTNRDRDMPVPQVFQKEKGAARFYQCIKEEIVPFIDNNYSTSGLNILIGHSQGALFASYAAVQVSTPFRFYIALDAPMTIIEPLKEEISKKLSTLKDLKYFSAETVYGWKNTFDGTPLGIAFKRINLEGESHESMPYKGIYEGLKYLFDDFSPKEKDLSLAQVKSYYLGLEQKYNAPYSIPGAVLLESAKQNIGQSKKDVALELLKEFGNLYDQSDKSHALTEKANAITKGPDKRVEYHLNHPQPTDEQIKPFLGKWEGVVSVPGGTDLEVSWEILKTGGKYVSVSLTMKTMKGATDFLYVNENNELVSGRKHNGGGIYISIGKLSKDGKTITGSEDLIGFDFPPDWPGGTFIPNTFKFTRMD